MRILHTADWHIGNYSGPEINGENARFLDICKCLDALSDKAAEENPDFIVVAGDIFHQARVWSDRGLRESQTAIHYIRLLEAIAPVIIVRGTPNHDSEQQYRMLETAFHGDDSVHIFTEPGVLTVYGYHGQQVNIAALPGFDRGYYRAKNPGLSSEEENAVFTQALENIIIGMRAECSAGIPSVLVGHYTITGCNTESGQTQLFAQYEPVVEPVTLAKAGYDLVCFGHIHRPQMLDGCNNTFYSGAISGLNFNDEKQERGFYIHELNDGAAPGREFYQLPTREFLTVRLQDEDIEAINGGDDMAWLSDVNGKIVRVLYNCTDEHNKALNKTMMEDKLYGLGAFWVQEITPETITATVSKTGFKDDDSPEANLRAYLEEKGIAEADAGRIVDRARDIIAEAVEANMTQRTTGLFMPVEIEVKNYRNYREESFSFDPIRFCTINGENGAGKSSLFMDAMCDALFEEPREGDITGWISNSPDARSGVIKFTFRLGEATYRVTRTRMKSGKATLNLAELVDGEWVDRSKEKMRDTQAEILNTIGMDSLTLKATALIMQDQYGLFLTADKEARMTILGSILGLGAYGDMEDIAGNKLTEVNREIRRTQEVAAEITASLPDEIELSVTISKKQEQIAEVKADAERNRSEAEVMQVRLAAMKEAAEQVVKIGARITATGGKKAVAESGITAQRGIIFGAEAILAERPAIETGLAGYRRQLEREKELLAAKTEYDSVYKQIEGSKASYVSVNQAIVDLLDKRKAALNDAVPARAIVEGATELEARHKDYETAKSAYEAVRSRGDVWRQAQQNASDADKAYKLCRADALTKVNEAKSILDGLIHRAHLLEENQCPHAESVRCRFLADALEAKDGIPAAEEAYSQAQERAKNAVDTARIALDEAIAAIPTDYTPEAEKAAGVLLSRLEVYEKRYGELAVAKAKMAALDERIKDIEAQIKEKEERSQALEEEINRQEARLGELAEAMSEYEQVQRRIAELAVYVEKEKQLPVAEEKKATAEARIKELENTIAELNSEIITLDVERTEAQQKTEGRTELAAKYSATMEFINNCDEFVQSESMALGALQENLDKARQQREKVKAYMEQAEKLGVTAADLDMLKQAFSQDGIPHNIVRSIIPIFEATATNILGQMSRGHMSVEFQMEKTLKSNSKKEVTALDIIINDSITGRLPYMSRSGGERVKAALAVILALAEIKSTKAGVQLGFLFIDEPPFLDAPGVSAYCDALEAIQQRYTNLKVMAITHDPAMKSRFPQSVDIVKTAEGSKVIYA